MDKYITQLIEMLREAQDQKPDVSKHMDFAEEMESIESLFENDHPTMAYHFGIPKEYFPPWKNWKISTLTFWFLNF